MPKDTFLFHKDWSDAISGLPAEVRLEVYEAIIEYGISGTLPNLKPMAMLAFNFVRQDIDRDCGQSERRRVAAKERWNANACKPMQVDAKSTDEYKSVQVDAKSTDEYKSMQVDAKSTSACKEKEKEEKEIFPPAPPIKEKEKKEKASSSLLRAKQREFYESLVPYVPKYGKEMIREFFDYWSEENQAHTKMRFEMEKTWGLSRRLATWKQKQQQFKQRDYANNSRYSTPEGRATEAAEIIARLAASE